MIGEYKLKYIAFALITLVFFAFSCQNLSAQETTFSPPGPEEVKSFWNNVSSVTKSIFQNIKKIGKGFSYLTPFFENISEKIGSWWSIQARSWTLIQWNCLSNYFEQEIKIE
jgi:hypothetical protein